MEFLKRPKQPKLGEKVRDIVTGFEGIVVSRTEWLNGCVRCGVQGHLKEDGSMPDAAHFDVEQLRIIPGGLRVEAQPSGGDRPSVARALDSKRE